MSIRKPNSLGKSERLKSRKQIDIIFDSGKKITQFPLRLIYRTEQVSGETGSVSLAKGKIKAGFTVSSKNFPRAVDRNRIKRLNREAYRLQKKELEREIVKTGMTLQLFFIFTGREIASFEEISIKLKQLLDKMIKLLHESNTSNS